MSADKPRRLGRGLEALLAVKQPAPRATEDTLPADDAERVRSIPLSQIGANPYQPRKEFREEELADLEASLKASGLLQPITVRPIGGDRYELIAGERRYRAATRLGWNEISAIVREVDDRTLLTLAIVENLQRVDLNPLEEAEGYRRLIDEFDLTQQQVADVVGKDRTTVTNLLRVLSLPDAVRGMLRDGAINLGHARALLALDDPQAMHTLAETVRAEGLSVREVERRVRAQNDPAAVETEPAPASEPMSGAGTSAAAPRVAPAPLPPHLRLVEDRLRRRLQTDVSLAVSGEERGTIRVNFYSADDLERLQDLLLGKDRSDFE